MRMHRTTIETINPLLCLLCNRICQNKIDWEKCQILSRKTILASASSYQNGITHTQRDKECMFAVCFVLLEFHKFRKEKHTYLMASSISHTVFMYHFNEYFYRKGINLPSLAKRNNKHSKKEQEHNQLTVLSSSLSSSLSPYSLYLLLFFAFLIMFGAVIRYLSDFFLCCWFRCLMTTCWEVNTLTNFHSLSQSAHNIKWYVNLYIHFWA